MIKKNNYFKLKYLWIWKFFLIFLFSMIFPYLYATEICDYKILTVVFKINPDGAFVISSGESVAFLAIKIPNEASKYCYEGITDYLNKTIFRKRVRLVCDDSVPEDFIRGKNNSYNVYVYSENGIFINAELIKEGLAIVDYSYNCKEIKNLEELEIKASEKKKGLWQLPATEVLAWRTRQLIISTPAQNEVQEEKIEIKKEDKPKQEKESELSKRDKLQKYFEMIQKQSSPNQESVTKPVKDNTESKSVPQTIYKEDNALKTIPETSNKDVNISKSAIETSSTYKDNADNIKISNENKTEIKTQPVVKEETSSISNSKIYLIGHKKLKIYHDSNCKKLKWIKTDKIYFNSQNEAEATGYKKDTDCLK
ncbi:thermonuclease family protein [Candidatus Poribacteria bacterium]|nr:thermonuclease family protein [Candidatus Poribacteria bacterium]